MKTYFSCYLLIISACFFSKCTTPTEQEYVPDVSDITVEYKTIRFEEILANVTKTNNVDKAIPMLQSVYSNFFNLYFGKVLPIKGLGGKEFSANLKAFYVDESIVKLRAEVSQTFGNYDEDVDRPLEKAFRYYKYYFPNFEAPNVYTFISEYSNQLIIFRDKEKDGIGIGLDMFLGDKYPYDRMARDNPAFSKYLVRTFNIDHLPRKVVNVLIEDRMEAPKGNRLIDHMIHNGKKLYILGKILPTTSKGIILEYTDKQMDWVTENELGMWAFFFDQELFYETNMMKINKYINPSPDSPGMPKGAPGRTANYMGLQIIKAYMKRFPKTSLSELINIKNAQEIMDKSKFKPQRK